MDKQSIFNQIKLKAKGAFKRAVEKAKNASPRFQRNLPYSMNDMIGMAIDYNIGLTKADDPYIVLHGVVVNPAEYEGTKFTITWFLNEGMYSSFEENLTAFLNDLTLLCGKTPTSIEEAEVFLKELSSQKVKFLFDTGKERKDNRPPRIYVKGRLHSVSNQEVEQENKLPNDDDVPF
jgi:hypothetical protein